VTRAQLAKMLVVTMGWGLIKPPFERFSDVPADSWMFPYVETVAARGAMSGFMDGSFEPNLPVTRRDAVVAVTFSAGKLITARHLLFRYAACQPLGCHLRNYFTR